MRTAIIANGVVANVVDLPGMTIASDGKSASGSASYMSGGQAVDYTAVFTAPTGSSLVASDTAGPGWTWTQAGGFVAPPPVAAPAQTIFQPRDFFALFTPAETVAMFTARRASVEVDQFITLAGMGPVDITNQTVIDDIGAVQAAGLLTAPRAAQILAGTPAPTS